MTANFFIPILAQIIFVRYYALLLSITFFINFNHAQENWCGFDHHLAQEKAKDPLFMEKLAQSVQQIRQEAANSNFERGQSFIIPVVFHIIHDGGAGNISMSQIQSGIDVMNEDFNAYNADAHLVRQTSDAPFQEIHADVQVEFRLAKIDPQGNCTNGVQRKFAPHLTNNAGESCKYSNNGGLDAWPNSRYINIWVVNSIAGSGQGTTLGYAFLPYNNWGAGHGILNRHDRIGRVGTAASFGGRTLTHEMGHICGLLHTFQGGCHTSDCSNSGDFICDTPPADQVWGCNSLLNTCNSVPINDAFGFDVFDQIENHMSYSSCRRMFSEGQKDLMHANFTGIPNFISITSQSNLEATGVLLPDEICKADFRSNQHVICKGAQIQFFDESYHAPVSWQWSFPGGMPSQSNSMNPAITYANPGTYEVSLTVSDGNNSASVTKTAFITVLDNVLSPPFFEGFENMTVLPASRWTSNEWGLDTGFEIADFVGRTGNQSVYLNNFDLITGIENELASGNIDLSGITDQVTLSFRFAYRRKNNDNNERLRVFVSNNCGDSWLVRSSLIGTALGTNTSSVPWQPNPEDWTTMHVTNISSSFWTENFRFKFNFLSDGGNNLYIDDINLYSGPPSEDLILSTTNSFDLEAIQVFPNPSEDIVQVKFALKSAEHITVKLWDYSGKEVWSSKIFGTSGANILPIPINEFSKGAYKLVLSGAQTNYQTTIIKN